MSKRTKVAIWVASVVAVLIAAYVGAQFYFADRVAPATTYLGADIGHLTGEEAQAVIDETTATWQGKPIDVVAGDAQATFDPAAASLTVDSATMVDALTGFTLDPRRLWQHFTSTPFAVEPRIIVKPAEFDAALQALAADVHIDPVDATLAISPDGIVSATDAVVGQDLNIDAARTALPDAWLTDTRPVNLPVTTTDPSLTQAELTAFRTDVVDPLLAGDVTVAVGSHQVPLAPATLATAASVTTDTGDFALTLDPQILGDAVMAADPTIGSEPVNATLEMVDGAPVLTPGVDGVSVDYAVLPDAVLAAITAPDRVATADAQIVEPDVTTASLEALGVTTKILEFWTPLTSEPKRTQNIRVANGKLTGTLVLPGETFSLLETIGPITYANGYIQAGTLQGGLHIDGLGGGLSQIATQVFNAGYQSGMVDIEHRPHTVFFPRYPAGNESTVIVGQVDVKWQNDTPYAVMLNAYIADGKTWIEVWSTPYWSIELQSTGKYDFVNPTTVNKGNDPRCEPSPAGQPGFSIGVTRIKTAPDGTQIVDKLFWRYNPDNAVTCG